MAKSKVEVSINNTDLFEQTLQQSEEFNRLSKSSIQDKGFYTFDESIIAAGGFGRFQIFMVAIYTIAFTSGSFLSYSSYLLFQYPVYMCKMSEIDEYQECDNYQACQSYSYYIDWSQDSSLDNWIGRLDLMCVDEKWINLPDTMFFVGVTLGSLFIPRLTDLYGRKKPFMICIILQFPLYIASILSTSINLTIAMSFFLGITFVGRYNGGYINIAEYVHTKWKNFVWTWLLVFDSLTVIVIETYFNLISKNWLWLQIFGASLNLIAIIGVYFIPESPEYLYSYYKFGKCRKAMNQIAKFNGKKMDRKFMFDVEEDFKDSRYFSLVLDTHQLNESYIIKEQHYSKSLMIARNTKANISEFLKRKDLVLNLLINIALWFITIMNYQIVGEYSNFFPGGEYANSIVLNTVELIAYIIAGLLYDRLGAQKLFIASYVISIVGSFGVLISNSSRFLVLDMIFTYLAKFGISAAYNGVYYSNGLFPIFFSSTTFGICNCFGGFSYVMSVYVIGLEENATFVIFTALSALAATLSIFLKDTTNTTLKF